MTVTSREQQMRPVGPIAVSAAGVLIVVGSLLPWMSATAMLIGPIDVAGVDVQPNGQLALLFGLLIVATGLGLLVLRGSPPLRLAAVLLAILVALLVLDALPGIVVTNVFLYGAQIADSSVGIGITVVGLGAVLAIIGASLASRPD